MFDMKMGMKGLAVAIGATFAAQSFVMRMMMSCFALLKDASFFPRCKTCVNMWQYLSYGIPQLILFWINTWHWQLMIFVSGWLGVAE